MAHAMEAQIQSAAATDRPAFFYHLGDVVYFNGLRQLYRVQFYEPYKYYPAPIFAIPGNHNGDTRDPEERRARRRENSCRLHRELLCLAAKAPRYLPGDHDPAVRLLDARSPVRHDHRPLFKCRRQPRRPRDERAQRWFEGQMRSATADKCLIVAVHHPPYSLDSDHGGSPRSSPPWSGANRVSGRWPDAVFSGHAHNYRASLARLTATDTLRRRRGRRLCQQPQVDAPDPARRGWPSRPRRETVPNHRRGRGPGILRRHESGLPAAHGRRRDPDGRVLHCPLRRRTAGSSGGLVPVELEDASPRR